MSDSKRPNFTIAQATWIAETQFGIVGEATELPSYIDQNFEIECDDGCAFILKIANPNEQRNWLEFETKCIAHLNEVSQRDIYPKVLSPNQPNKYWKSTDPISPIAELSAASGRSHLVRMMNFLPGTLFSELESPSTELLVDVGRVVAEVDIHFQKLPFDIGPSKRFFWWDCQSAPIAIRQNIASITDTRRRQTIETLLRHGESNLACRFALPMSVIHNDMNDNNFLVAHDRVSGVFDFGDVVYSYTINDVAVACAYLMLGRDNPIEVGRRILKGYQAVNPRSNQELQSVFDLIILRLMLSVTTSAKQQSLEPENEYLSISEQPAWNLLERFADQNLSELSGELVRHETEANNPVADSFFNSPRAKSTNQTTTRSKSELLKLRKKLIGPNLSLSYQNPLKIVRGQGTYLFDEQNRKFLDCVNNVCHVGHCNSAVVEAAVKQLSELNTNTRYLHDNIVEYARELTATLPDSLEVCYFVNSGSEANDLALRIARAFTGKKDFIVLEHAYHGTTGDLIELSPYKLQGAGGSKIPAHVHVAPIPDRFRGEFQKNDPEAGYKYAQQLGEIVEKLSQRNGLAAFVAESASGCGGQIIFPNGYFKCAFEHVRNSGGLCILDEVQVGFGRFGSHMWAFETQNVIPDIVTMGKPAGNGHPLGIVVTTRDIADAFDNGMEYFNTFGGNPVSCAIGLSVLDVLENGKLQQNALSTGSYFLNRLRALHTRFPVIGDVRGTGLFIGIEFVKDPSTLEPAADIACQIKEEMRNRGILLSTDGPFNNVIKIKPPMVFGPREVDQVVDNLEAVLSEVS